MIDARIFIKNALETTGYKVRQNNPEGQVDLPLITYAEAQNAYSGINQVNITYDITAYANTFEEIIEMADKIDDVMSGMGFQRRSVSSDADARLGKDLYAKSLSFRAMVDTRNNNIYQHKIRE